MSMLFDPEHIRLLLEKTGAIPWRADAKSWQFTYVGPQAEKLLGFPIVRWYEKDFWVSRLHPDDRDSAVEFCQKSANDLTNYSFEYRMVGADGRAVWLYDIVHVEVKDGAPDCLFGFFIDVTDRKQAEQELIRQRAFLRQVVDVNPNFVFAKDRLGRFTFVNRAVADAFATTVEDMIGKTDADFNPNAEEVEFFRRMDLEVMDTLKERFIPEEKITDAHGKIRWLQTVKCPITEKDGSVNQILGVSTDITKRRETEAEIERQRVELAHVTRISVIGELSASLAHELNQPLTAILSNAQAAQRFLAVDPADLMTVKEILKDIVQDSNRAAEVIRRLRAFIKKEKSVSERLDLADIVGAVMLLTHSDAVQHNIRVSREFSGTLPPVRGDRIQLQQVVLNLLLNAFDGMKDTPAVERRVVVRSERDGADMIRVGVRDRGTGLSADKLHTIFEPFYTTKPEGLGMGLSISRSIIEAHGGRLWVENNADRGVTFFFTVPVEKRGERRAPGGVRRRPMGIHEQGATGEA